MTEEEARRSAALELFKNGLAHHETLASALVAFGQSALKVSYLLNGGAVVAALSVYGAKAGEAAPLPKWMLGTSVACWLVGLFFSAQSTGLITQAQREFQALSGNTFRQQGRQYFQLPIPLEEDSTEPHLENGRGLRNRAIDAWKCSIGLFGAGAAVALLGLIFF